MNRPRDYQTKQVQYATAYMWDLKYNTNQRIYETKIRLADTENKLALAKGELEVGGEERLPGNLGLPVAHYYILKK